MGKERLFEVMRKVNPDFKPINENYSESTTTYLNPQLKKRLEYKGYNVGQTANGGIVIAINDVLAQILPDGRVELGGDATIDMFPEDFPETIKMIQDEINDDSDALNENASNSKTFTLNLWGQDEELYFVFNKYGNNGALAVQLMSPTEGAYATISTNLPESAKLAPDEFFMKAWSENQEIAEQLIQKQIVLPTGKSVQSGYVNARSYKLNPIYGNTGIGDVSANE